MATKKTTEKKAPAKKAPAKKTATVSKLRISASAKDAATKRNEPYVNVVSVELDPDDVGNGAFELDWNDLFIAKLVKAGYKGRDDAQIVDQWFQDICRNVLMENFEQWEANQPPEARIIQKRDLGDGRSEIS